MRQWQRITFYLLLNILVSACTTLGVLVLWDRTQGPLPGGLLASLGSPGQAAPTTAAAPAPAGTPAAAPADGGAPQPTPTRVFIAYEVKDGETFESIAQAHGVTPEELMAENGFTSNVLGAGEVIRIPVGPAEPASQGDVLIENVIGVGDLASERVVLKHSGSGQVLLSGWRIEDEDGSYFVFPQFPQLTLFENGAVNLNTRSGTDTVSDLFWGLDRAVFRSGERVVLYDATGQERSSFQVP